MKIILNKTGVDSKILLDDGTDITKDLRVYSVKVETAADEITMATLVVYPSEVVVELDDGQLQLVKHPDWGKQDA